MSEFIPNPNEGEMALKAVSCNAGPAEITRPKAKLPEPGDTMRLAVDPWGYWRVVDVNYYPQGEQIIVEVEVKGFQKPVLTYETV